MMRTFRKYLIKRKIKRRLVHVKFDLIEANPKWDEYRQGGEYQGLLWLRAYVSDKTSEDPMKVVRSVLRGSAGGGTWDPSGMADPRSSALFAETILRYIT